LATKIQPEAIAAGTAAYQTVLPESVLPMMATTSPARMHPDNNASRLTWLGAFMRGR
jgi:hypothetical protein